MITDTTDKSLLHLLRCNSRASIAELARELSLSRSTVKDRISRLEKKGVIKGYSLVLSDEYTKGHVSAHVMVSLASGSSAQTMRNLKDIEQITIAYAVSGIYDLIVLVEAESTGELDKVLDDIREIEGIKDTVTSVVLSTKFER
ncbi:Lrp/AsnC family transcriptional regulator [Agarilytica rhodophyticola]|uniref:Lrp/AsnC family transcriptional regulator n=1 Tax=Agarilytica rhodophyticola TaxID=1737490 RepID=UPI000B344400|nr:Lrp/AsnC family transcriptional regulator [Agarilytica rhodophyticola]